jgi:hypothetical protein
MLEAWRSFWLAAMRHFRIIVFIFTRTTAMVDAIVVNLQAAICLIWRVSLDCQMEVVLVVILLVGEGSLVVKLGIRRQR